MTHPNLGCVVLRIRGLKLSRKDGALLPQSHLNRFETVNQSLIGAGTENFDVIRGGSKMHVCLFGHKRVSARQGLKLNRKSYFAAIIIIIMSE